MTVKVTQLTLSAMITPALDDHSVSVTNVFVEVLGDAPPPGGLHLHGVQFSHPKYNDPNVTIPPGDRGAFDTHLNPTLHSSDLQTSTPKQHNPWPATTGQAPVSDGSKYVATDIATQAELQAHIDQVNPHGTSFRDLSDTPGTFVGQANKIPKVNAGETALEFVVIPDGIIATIGTYEGNLAVATSPFRLYNRYGGSRIIQEVFISANTAPVGAAVIVDILKSGTSIFSAQGNMPQIASGANTGLSTTFAASTWAASEYLQFDIVQVGSSTEGANLTVQIMTTPGAYA